MNQVKLKKAAVKPTWPLIILMIELKLIKVIFQAD